MHSFHIALADAVATERWAARLAALGRPGDCITLSGSLGAGKTTFARGFIQALAGPVEVTSPTFVLLQTYATGSGISLWHADLYRLKTPEELSELGLEEARESGILLVEWPEIGQGWLPADSLQLALHIPENQPQARVLVGNSPSAWYIRLMEAKLII